MLPMYSTSTQIIPHPLKFSKVVSFINNDTKQQTSIPFPPSSVYPITPPSNNVSELSHKFKQYLNDIGIVRHHNIDMHPDHKVYNCELSFNINHHQEKFQILLNLVYQMNQFDEQEETTTPANLFVSNEELLNYLRDKIVLNNVNPLSGIESKINILLRLCTITCFINEVEIEI
ncbi:hypothetical protein JA1_005264 [Spathaspora sp. JA1]|nr:hypothetical protein JA1_005264 [Spathaspora sp. JA1]